MNISEARSLYFDYLRFPSISASPAHAADVRACAEWLASLLAGWGLPTELRETGGAPIVLTKTICLPGRPTVLLYGHYDVQPVEPLELWDHPPFEPVEREGLIFARGATDNKGQTFSHLIGLRRLLDQGTLPVNLIILLEGEEEVGSPHLAAFLEEHREELRCDCAVISDTSMIAEGWPALTLGLRGIACFEVAAVGPSADLHSGMFGGATANPAMALSRVLARLHDDSGRIAIPGFYDAVLPISETEKTSWSFLPWNETWFRDTTGIAPNSGETGCSVLERVWGRPTAEINGLTSGHQGTGSKTIIPSRASAKLSFRLVPNQDPERIAGLVTSWLEEELKKEGVRAEVEYDHGGLPFYVAPDHPCIQAAAVALQTVFGREPALTREGLSIPVTALLAQRLGIPVLLAGLGLPNCSAHAPNESFPASHLELGAQTHIALMSSLAIALAR